MDYVMVEKEGKSIKISPVDTVVTAAGVKSVNSLADAARKLGITVLKTGDASSVKNGMKNIWEGYSTGYYLKSNE